MTGAVGNVRLDDSVRHGDFCGFDRRRSKGYMAQLPIDIGIDSFQPRHYEDHSVAAKRSDKEYFFMDNTSDSELENGDAICMDELRSVGNSDLDRSAWYCGKSRLED